MRGQRTAVVTFYHSKNERRATTVSCNSPSRSIVHALFFLPSKLDCSKAVLPCPGYPEPELPFFGTPLTRFNICHTLLSVISYSNLFPLECTVNASIFGSSKAYSNSYASRRQSPCSILTNKLKSPRPRIRATSSSRWPRQLRSGCGFSQATRIIMCCRAI